jgi:prepilin peptidase CpaA
MHSPFIPLLFSGALSLAMLLVILLDATRYVIPNLLNLIVLLLYLVALFFLPLNPLMGLMTAGLVLAVGLGLFALGFMGGGDVKLLTVLALWTGWSSATANLFFLTGIIGGLLVVVILLMRAIVTPLLFRTRTPPRLLTRKQPIPYGLAIAPAFLVLLWLRGIPALH